MITIEKAFVNHMVITRPAGESVSIADLAIYLEFKPSYRRDTSMACLAAEALDSEYGKHEINHMECDYYNGIFVEFADNSTLCLIDRN